MDKTIKRLENLLLSGREYFRHSEPDVLNYKASELKWSRKEILGHLIDSGINNLQRFTEIQFSAKPYPVKKYNQVELVKANSYQDADIYELLDFWICINKRIVRVVNHLTTKELALEIVVNTSERRDLRFLITDYVDHMEHHLKQINCEV
jgi:hypothetical protein